jgi:hypothetical protein
MLCCELKNVAIRDIETTEALSEGAILLIDIFVGENHNTVERGGIDPMKELCYILLF